MDASQDSYPQNQALEVNGRNTPRSDAVTALTKPPVEVPEQPGAVQPPEPPKSKRRNRPILFAALGLGAVVAGSFGFRWWQYASTHQETDNATVAGHVFQISSRLPGTVLAVPVEDNQQVEPGDILVQLDPAEYQVKVQQAQAALAVAQRQAETAQAGISLSGQTAQGQNTEAQGNLNRALASISTAQAAVSEAQSGVPVAQAELTQTEANLVKVKADLDRYQSLYSSGAVSKQQLDSAQAAYDMALAQKKAAAQRVNQAQAKLIQAQEGVTQAQAQLEASRGGLQQAQAGSQQTEVSRRQYAAANAAIAQAQSSLAEAQLQLSYTNIKAPATGHVGRKTVEVGERLQAGQALMAVVGNEIWVTANFKETQIGQIRSGQLVEVKLDAFPGQSFSGRVNSFSPASGAEFALLPPDNATGNFTKVVQRIPVKIVLNAESVKGHESQISPGMSATAAVDISQ